MDHLILFVGLFSNLLVLCVSVYVFLEMSDISIINFQFIGWGTFIIPSNSFFSEQRHD